MAGAACEDYAKTKPIRQVASCERKALPEMGPGRILKTKLSLDNMARFSKRTHLRAEEDGGRKTDRIGRRAGLSRTTGCKRFSFDD